MEATTNNRQDARHFGELLDFFTTPAVQTPLAQRTYNRVIRKQQIDRQLGASYVRLEGGQEIIGCWKPDNEPGRQFITFLTDTPDRVFIADAMPLTRDGDTGMIVPLMMPDPDYPSMHIIATPDYVVQNIDSTLKSVQKLDHCTQEARKIVAKLGTRAADGCYAERDVIALAFWPDIEAIGDFIRDLKAAMQYFTERALFGSPEDDIIAAEDDEADAVWGDQ